MYKIKIYGAGSIGNHLAHAARSLEWGAVVCDTDPRALERMRSEIYPARYGAWDPAIQQFSNDAAPRGDFDVIFVGTPPDSHLPIALEAAEEAPRAMLIEKPLCTPDLDRAQALYDLAVTGPTRYFVGYDHVVGRATEIVEEVLRSGTLGAVHTIDVEFREHWGGIFAAHPWLAGPHESYLGYSARGGGATGEHSHAINLWQHFAHVVGAGRVQEVSATLRHVQDGALQYDDLSLLTLRTESGLLGRVVQDVITRPHRKRAWIQGTEGAIHWVCGHDAGGDAVIVSRPGAPDDLIPVPKRRPDDFIRELEHVRARLENPVLPSSIALERGLDTMMVIAAARLSDRHRSAVRISGGGDYSPDALEVDAPSVAAL